MNKYLLQQNVLQRLIDEYTQHGKLIVAFDFDDTVCTYNKACPEPTSERPANEEICELLRELRPYAEYIVWTCRAEVHQNANEEFNALQEALNWLDAHNVPYDAVNTDGKVNYGGRKIYANIFLDDRGGLASAYETLVWFLRWVKGEQNV